MNESSIKKSERNNYKSRIGVVMQDDTPFEGTFYENLTFNSTEYTNDDINWALNAVELDSFVKKLPAGMETPIYSDGRQLTRSVIQKILIARAILNRPKILLLEEPTINMDSKAARKIIDFLVSAENNWTIIVSSVDEYWKTVSDRIVVMDNGEIIEDLKTKGNA